MEEKQKEIVYYREGVVKSIIADVVMFVLIISAIAINHFYLGGSGVWAVLLFVMVLIAITSKSYAKRRTFHSKKELIDYLKEE